MKPLTLFIFAIFAASSLPAQQKDENLLFKYLQKKFDTAYVFDGYSSWDLNWPDYKIVGIKNNSLFFFKYSNPKGRIYSREYNETKPDSNAYFVQVPVAAAEQEKFRASLDSINLWAITTDDRSNCRFSVSDGGHADFYLFSKRNDKKIKFYEPGYYEKACPGDKNRQVAIHFIRLMNSVIPW